MAVSSGSFGSPKFSVRKIPTARALVWELDLTDEGKRDELREQLAPLCFMKRVEHKIQIAWGGPEYGFKLYYDPECKEWVSGLFYWADWFKYEEEPLSPEELDKVLDAYSMDCQVE